MAVFGIYFTFFSKTEKNGSEKKEVTQNTEEKFQSEYDYTNKGLPEQENESESESYVEGKDIKVYFTNTDKLDKSSLPLEAQQILCSKTQIFLYSSGFEDVTELKILDTGFSDNERKVTFVCEIPGYEEMLRVTYKNEKLKFAIIIMEKIKE